MKMMFIFASILILLPFNWSEASESTLSLIMPGIPPKNISEDDYLCTAFKTNSEESEYITEFKPNASNPSILHHILIYGCETPADPKAMTKGYVWKCGDLPDQNCGAGRMRTLYSWSRDAPTFTLPDGVGFKVGGDSKIDYLILHVHYMHVHQIKEPEDSGIFLKMVPKSDNKITKSAGMLAMESDGTKDKSAVIKAHSTLYFENACPMNTTKALYPVAIRPNTNGRGTVVSGWRIKDIRGKAKWTLIGRYSPNPKQAFYHIKDKSLAVNPGEWLAMRCTEVNNNDHDIYFGANDSNETCNLYLIYYVDGDEDFNENMICMSFGPPYYSWKSDLKLPGGRVPGWVNKAASRRVFEN